MRPYLRPEWAAALSAVPLFVPRDRFVVTKSDLEEPWITYIDPKLQRIIDSVPPEQNIPMAALQVATFTSRPKPSPAQLVEELELTRLVPFANLHHLLSMQPRGEKNGRLLVNGFATHAPITIIDGAVHLMSMRYFDGEQVKESPRMRTISYGRDGWVLGLVNVEDDAVRFGERLCYHFQLR